MERWKSWKLGWMVRGMTVAVSETWFSEQSNLRTGIQGYRVYRYDRKEKKEGGVGI